ncbi:hypothetical protein HDU93_007557 [Gonapodya sp. JEL0774]|nr:hypothetical protein HDU93_007557 [Gonapodya sp. JEL0774]
MVQTGRSGKSRQGAAKGSGREGTDGHKMQRQRTGSGLSRGRQGLGADAQHTVQPQHSQVVRSRTSVSAASAVSSLSPPPPLARRRSSAAHTMPHTMPHTPNQPTHAAIHTQSAAHSSLSHPALPAPPSQLLESLSQQPLSRTPHRLPCPDLAANFARRAALAQSLRSSVLAPFSGPNHPPLPLPSPKGAVVLNTIRAKDSTTAHSHLHSPHFPYPSHPFHLTVLPSRVVHAPLSHPPTREIALKDINTLTASHAASQALIKEHALRLKQLNTAATNSHRLNGVTNDGSTAAAIGGDPELPDQCLWKRRGKAKSRAGNGESDRERDRDHTTTTTVPPPRSGSKTLTSPNRHTASLTHPSLSPSLNHAQAPQLPLTAFASASASLRRTSAPHTVQSHHPSSGAHSLSLLSPSRPSHPFPGLLVRTASTPTATPTDRDIDRDIDQNRPTVSLLSSHGPIFGSSSHSLKERDENENGGRDVLGGVGGAVESDTDGHADTKNYGPVFVLDPPPPPSPSHSKSHSNTHTISRSPSSSTTSTVTRPASATPRPPPPPATFTRSLTASSSCARIFHSSPSPSSSFSSSLTVLRHARSHMGSLAAAGVHEKTGGAAGGGGGAQAHVTSETTHDDCKRAHHHTEAPTAPTPATAQTALGRTVLATSRRADLSTTVIPGAPKDPTVAVSTSSPSLPRDSSPQPQPPHHSPRTPFVWRPDRILEGSEDTLTIAGAVAVAAGGVGVSVPSPRRHRDLANDHGMADDAAGSRVKSAPVAGGGSRGPSEGDVTNVVPVVARPHTVPRVGRTCEGPVSVSVGDFGGGGGTKGRPQSRHHPSSPSPSPIPPSSTVSLTCMPITLPHSPSSPEIVAPTPRRDSAPVPVLLTTGPSRRASAVTSLPHMGGVPVFRSIVDAGEEMENGRLEGVWEDFGGEGVDRAASGGTGTSGFPSPVYASGHGPRLPTRGSALGGGLSFDGDRDKAKSRRGSVKDGARGSLGGGGGLGNGMLRPGGGGGGKGAWRASGLLNLGRTGSAVGSRGDLGGGFGGSRMNLGGTFGGSRMNLGGKVFGGGGAPEKKRTKKKKSPAPPADLSPSLLLIRRILSRLALRNLSDIVTPEILHRALIPPPDTYIPLPNSPRTKHHRPPLWERYASGASVDAKGALEEAVLERERPARWALSGRREDGDADPTHRAMLANERALVVEERLRKRGRMGKYAYRPARAGEGWSAAVDGDDDGEGMEERAKWVAVPARTRSWWDRAETARFSGRRSVAREKYKQKVRFTRTSPDSDATSETPRRVVRLRSGRMRDLDEFETFTDRPSTQETANRVTVVTVPRAVSEELWNLEMGRPAREKVVEAFLRKVDKEAVELKQGRWFPSPPPSRQHARTDRAPTVILRVQSKRSPRFSSPESSAGRDSHNRKQRNIISDFPGDDSHTRALNHLFGTAGTKLFSGGGSPERTQRRRGTQPGAQELSFSLTFASAVPEVVSVGAYQQMNSARYRGGIS